MERCILTTEGYIKYFRYVLRPRDAESAERLNRRDNARTVVPLDSVLGVGNLPFKVSARMMLEIAYWGTKLSSYQETEEFFLKTKGIQIQGNRIYYVHFIRT